MRRRLFTLIALSALIPLPFAEAAPPSADAHLAAMKAGLRLNATQAHAWPAFETAIRDANAARATRWREAKLRMATGERPTPIERLGLMADHLDKSAAELRTIAQAAKPLYESLTEAQKRAFGNWMREFRPKSQV